jgi:formylglycine-generating enzyme
MRTLFFSAAAALLLVCSCAGPLPQDELAWVEEGDFWIDRYEVTVGAFREYVETTGYRTTADSLGWSGVFDLSVPGWAVADGANWEFPDGQTAAEAREPVRHISYYDACAYCAWKGGALPTADEWDLAAGPEVLPGNIWHGRFPFRDDGDDGYTARIAPVGKFSPNELGLYDMFGNVWEWTQTRFDGERHGSAFIAGQLTPETIESGRIIKGGSYLCDHRVCSGFIPERFQVTPEDSGLDHLGFRCVYRP